MDLEFHQLEQTYQALRIHDGKRQARLMASLPEHGQQGPVLAVKHRMQSDRYVLIDGYERVATLQKLGRDTVAAIVLPLALGGKAIARARVEILRRVFHFLAFSGCMSRKVYCWQAGAAGPRLCLLRRRFHGSIRLWRPPRILHRMSSYQRRPS